MNLIDQSTNQRQCLICGERKIYYNFSIGKFRVEKCLNCTLMRINPQPTEQESISILNRNKEKIVFEENYFNLLETYNEGPLKGSLLQIGSVHINHDKIENSKDLNITELSEDKIQENIQSFLDAEKHFDYIILINILHKIRDPRNFLKKIHTLLNDKGTILTILPTLDSPSARIMKSRWSGFNPLHFWYFSKSTISRLFHTEAFGELKLHLKKSTLFLIAKKESIQSTKRLSIVMPAYNEAKSIKKAIDSVLAKKIEGIKIELIIVESNSKDGTKEIVKQYETHERVTILWQDAPQGKGNAVRAGLAKVSGNYILIQDADDEYDIEDYDALIEPLMTGEATFVLGARHGGGAWKMRQFEDQKITGHLLNLGHWFFATLVNITYGLKLKDPFTMYKVFRADCLRGIKLECNYFDFDYELLIKLVKAGYDPIEIPVNYRSRSFKEGKKVSVLRDPWTWIVAIFKYRFQ